MKHFGTLSVCVMNLLPVMHRINNLKFTSAQQASEIYRYKNITVTLYKNMQQFGLINCVGSCKLNLITFVFKVSEYNRLCQNALKATTRIRVNQELGTSRYITFIQ
jgi:hypothetical protein